MLFGREVAEQREVGDQMSCGFVCEVVVDARGPRAAGAAIPVLVGAVGGCSLAGVTFGDVAPSCLSHLDEESREAEIDIGVPGNNPLRIRGEYFSIKLIFFRPQNGPL